MSWWQYLLLVNVYLILFYGFYALLLRKETFFQLNRIYLVSAAALSFFIPMMQADWVQNLFITQEIKYTVYGSPILISQLAPVKDVPLNIGQILGAIYIAGVVVLFGRLIWQLVALNRIIKKDQHDTAYSFFNKIKLPDDVKDNNIVSLHEQVHARQWHSIDVLVIEAVMIINWFNPIVYFYRRAIKHIHEFIADDHATKQAANKADYALLLLTQTFHVPSHSLVNSFFNHSLLKQRIIMLQKDKSQRIKLIKYGLSAPLFMLMLILTSATVNNSKTVKAINNKITQVLLLPPPPISSITKLSTESAMSDPATMAIMKKNQELTADNSPAAVTDTPHEDNSQIFSAVEKEPEFPGGQAKFAQFLADNIKYPQDMVANGTSGRVIATFVVEKDGSLSNIKILRAPTPSAGDEAARVLALSPKWTPGYQNGQAVRVQYTVPVAFNTGVKVIGYKSQTDTGKHISSVVVSNDKTNVTYVVDGKEMSSADISSINPNTIQTINVTKDASAKPGSKEANGVVYITTGITSKKPATTTAQFFERADVTYMVDGKEATASDAKIIVNSQNFQTMYLTKAPSAGNKGIIEITTKKPINIVLVPPGKNDPLYILDGKEIKPEDFKNINPGDIKSVSVLKDKAAIVQYGEKGKNGVILISTKTAGSSPVQVIIK